MSDTVITMNDGSKWSPATSTQVIQCANCDNVVDTEAEAQSYANNGTCPDCNQSWTEKRTQTITVAMPQSLGGGTM